MGHNDNGCDPLSAYATLLRLASSPTLCGDDLARYVGMHPGNPALDLFRGTRYQLQDLDRMLEAEEMDTMDDLWVDDLGDTEIDDEACEGQVVR